MFYRNDRAGSQCSESWMLFVIIFTGWHFLGQVEASCSCFTCTMPRIHCTPTRCPLVHIVNSCSPKHGLSWDQLVFLPRWWELPYSQYWLLAKAKHKQEATTVSNSPFSNVHPPGTDCGAWHWAATFIRTTDTIPRDKYHDLKRAEIVSLINMNGYNLQNKIYILHYQESAETKGLVFSPNHKEFSGLH